MQNVGNIISYINNNKFLISYPLVINDDDNSKFTSHNIRKLRDITTSEFTNIFLMDNETRYLFLDYVFHELNSGLLCEINNLLIGSSNLPLYSFEMIYMVFKGGNVMNFFFGNISRTILQMINADTMGNISGMTDLHTITPEYPAGTKNISQFINDISSKFQVSDVDFSAYIYAANSDRYLVIHPFVLRILASKLKIITNNFESLYNNMGSDYEYLCNNIPNTVDNIDTNNDYSFGIDLKMSLSKFMSILPVIDDTTKFNALFRDLNLRPLVDTFVTELRNNINNIHNFVNMYRLCYIVMIIDILIFIKSKINDIYDNIDLQHHRALLIVYKDLFVKKKFENLVRKNFYNTNKFNQLKLSLRNEFRNLSTQATNGVLSLYENLSSGITQNIREYELTNFSNIEDTSFNILPRKNIIMSRPNDYTLNVLSDNMLCKHYITYNNIIAAKRGDHDVKFDLLRSKFNVALVGSFIRVNGVSKNINIPSEFIDISIPGHFDESKNEYTHRHHNHPASQLKFDLDDGSRYVIINGYDLNDVYFDLVEILFKQNFVLPWTDKKFSKRISRLLFIGLLRCTDDIQKPNTEVISCIEQYKLLINICKKMMDNINVAQIKNSTSNNNIVNNFPYDDVKDFFNINDTNYVRNALSELQSKKEKCNYYGLLKFKDEYNLIYEILFCVIICGYFALKDGNRYDLLIFFNYYRAKYNWVNYSLDDLDDLNTFIDKYIEFLDTIIKEGSVIVRIFENYYSSVSAQQTKTQTKTGGYKRYKLKKISNFDKSY